VAEVEIRVGGISLTMSRDEAATVAAQLAEVGITAETSMASSMMIIADDHPMWSLHSGGGRHDGPDWGPGDEQLAEGQYRLPPLTTVFHRALVDHPGRLLSVEDLGRITRGALSSRHVIAGALSGYAQWCTRLNRRFPFYWWEGRDGKSSRYAMQLRVAALFRASPPDDSYDTRVFNDSNDMRAFWVYENWTAQGHRATVHRANCSFCNNGRGVHGGGQTRNGRWHGPFSSSEDAASAVCASGAAIRECARCNP
jgi:hypothetical protein